MYCKMDVDDFIVKDPEEFRMFACGCTERPIKPLVEFGCRCPSCGAICKKCAGFGFSQEPEKRFYQILSQIRSRIKRQLRSRGKLPSYIRLTESQINILIRKMEEDAKDHWIREFVDVGPPMRIFDVLTVIDRRRR